MVYWLTGLSGAGKTTIGNELYAYLRQKKPNVVLLDGDALREMFGGDLGYSMEDRRKSAMRNAQLCRMLGLQGIDVVCCTISMFDEVREWNRHHIKKYREIYLKVSPEVLEQRNQKGLYKTDKKDLVGFGISMEEPREPDMVILNNGDKEPKEILHQIMEMFDI